MSEAVVMYSGGIASFVAALRTVERYGHTQTTLLFCDTKQEDEDLYRFLREGAAYLDVPLVEIADGRTPWQVFRDVRFLGNTRADPCSRILKRNLARTWMEQHASPGTTVVLGLDSCEMRRVPKVQRFWAPWPVALPLLSPPYLDKDACRQLVRTLGLTEPRLYALGFPNNNCGGRCVKGGQAYWLHLLRVMPERFAEDEANEAQLRQALGKNVAILRDRRGGTTKPYTLRQLREQGQTDQEELWGSCGCFTDGEE